MKILRNKWLVVLTTKIGSEGVNGPEVSASVRVSSIRLPRSSSPYHPPDLSPHTSRETVRSPGGH